MLERAARPTVGAVVGQKIRPGFVRASAAQQEYMAIMKASDREREVHKATLQDAKSIAHNNIVMAKVCTWEYLLGVANACLLEHGSLNEVQPLVVVQESEGLEIPPEVSDKGVNTLLRTPSKGHFYVMRVWSKLAWQCVEKHWRALRIRWCAGY